MEVGQQCGENSELVSGLLQVGERERERAKNCQNQMTKVNSYDWRNVMATVPKAVTCV